jgi:2-keto-3-deoxy-L-rhamnonate aldolase RhmA
MSNLHHAFRGSTQKEYVEWANADTPVIIQPETQLALDNIEKLVSIPGVDGVMIGPSDLSVSLGISGELKHPRMVEVYEKVIAACRKHGVSPGVHLMDTEWAKEWIAKGMRFLTYYTDIRFLMEGARNATRRLPESPESKK